MTSAPAAQPEASQCTRQSCLCDAWVGSYDTTRAGLVLPQREHGNMRTSRTWQPPRERSQDHRPKLREADAQAYSNLQWGPVGWLHLQLVLELGQQRHMVRGPGLVGQPSTRPWLHFRLLRQLQERRRRKRVSRVHDVVQRANEILSKQGRPWCANSGDALASRRTQPFFWTLPSWRKEWLCLPPKVAAGFSPHPRGTHRT
jgi:hypothetical protein